MHPNRDTLPSTVPHLAGKRYEGTNAPVWRGMTVAHPRYHALLPAHPFQAGLHPLQVHAREASLPRCLVIRRAQGAQRVQKVPQPLQSATNSFTVNVTCFRFSTTLETLEQPFPRNMLE